VTCTLPQSGFTSVLALLGLQPAKGCNLYAARSQLQYQKGVSRHYCCIQQLYTANTAYVAVTAAGLPYLHEISTGEELSHLPCFTAIPAPSCLCNRTLSKCVSGTLRPRIIIAFANSCSLFLSAINAISLHSLAATFLSGCLVCIGEPAYLWDRRNPHSCTTGAKMHY